jgi:hypothetical protein
MIKKEKMCRNLVAARFLKIACAIPYKILHIVCQANEIPQYVVIIKNFQDHTSNEMY